MSDDVAISNEEWAVEEFAEVDLKDERLNKRCQESARALKKRSVNIFQNSADKMIPRKDDSLKSS